MRVLKYIGRISPYKGLSDLLQAFDIDGWKLRIVGPDQDGYVAELKQLAERLGISDKVEFVGPKFGEELTKEYASADLFVLPTYSENFGSVVIESLAQGVPVICTKGAPWKELEDYGCGWWPDIGIEPLQQALHAAVSLSDAERKEMGRKGKRLVEEKYTWKAACAKLMAGYEQVIVPRSSSRSEF